MKEKIQTSYGKANFYRNEAANAQERIMLIPGYSEGVVHNRKLVDALANEGYDAFAYSQPSGFGSEDPLERRSHVAYDVLETAVPEGEKIHLVAHSLGAADALRLAIEAPERVASITLMQPAGMVGEQSFLELSKRVMLKKVPRNQIRAAKGQGLDTQPKNGSAALVDKESRIKYSLRVGQAQAAGSNALTQNPALALEEANAAGGYDIQEVIQELSSLGIPVNIVKSHSDELFDTDKVDQAYETISEAVSSYSSVWDYDAGHDTSWMQPERTAKIVDALVNQALQQTTVRNK